MTAPEWGRFTADGGAQVERDVRAIMEEVRTTVAKAVDADRFDALVLLGGYGRGEGGVEIRDGRERPHNNFDLLLVTRRGGPREREDIRRLVLDGLKPIAEAHGLAIDLGVVSRDALRFSAPTIMWYDVRFGHKTLLGDPGVIRSLLRHDLSDVPHEEFLRLLVNRGTLLLINELLLSQLPEELCRRTIVKHAMKAIIGYGDAALHMRGRYHWSYRTRQIRMHALLDFDPQLRRLYLQALDFRFRTRYHAFDSCDLRAWHDEIIPILRRAHLAFERWRLHEPDLRWDDYPRATFRALGGWPCSLKSAVRRLRQAATSEACPVAAERRVRLGYRLGGLRARLDAFFPLIEYGVGDATTRSFARKALGARTEERADLIRAYLRTWGKTGDPNFSAVAQALRLDLDPAATTALRTSP